MSANGTNSIADIPINVYISRLTGCTHLVLVLFGYLGIVIVFVPVIKTKDLRQLPAYKLMSALAVVDFTSLTVLTYYSILGWTLCHQSQSAADIANTTSGFVQASSWFVAEWLYLSLATSRIVYICAPSFKEKIFGGHKTDGFIFWSYAAGVAMSLVFVLPNGVSLFYAAQYCTYIFDVTSPYFEAAILMNDIANFVTVSVLPLTYIPILWKLRKGRRALGRSEISIQELKITLSFFIQYVVMVVSILSYRVLAYIPGDAFTTTCVAKHLWAAVPVLDSWIYLVVNSKLRRTVMVSWGCSTAVVGDSTHTNMAISK